MLGVLVEEKDVILLFKNKKLQEAYFFLKRILNEYLVYSRKCCSFDLYSFNRLNR